MQRTLVLDLDGTLVDSVDDLTVALNHVLQARGLPATERREVTLLVGNGAAALLQAAFAARGAVSDEAALAAFLADYTAHSAVLTRPFPGVEATLAEMAGRGWQFAVCTNKPEAAAQSLLRDLKLAHWFAAVGGGDSFPTRKPDPAHLLATLAAAGGAVGRAVMVGDHANDVAAAQGAGVPCVFAGWGYGRAAMADGAIAVAAAFAELPGLCEGLVH
jgi:phosphoglycolate phosphatase